MSAFITAAVLLPEVISGFQTDDLCVRQLFTCDHLLPSNKQNQAIVVLCTTTMAVMMMVVSHVIILRIIQNSAKWRSTNANRASTQKRAESAKVSAFPDPVSQVNFKLVSFIASFNVFIFVNLASYTVLETYI